jgi:hypothetical protein
VPPRSAAASITKGTKRPCLRSSLRWKNTSCRSAARGGRSNYRRDLRARPVDPSLLGQQRSSHAGAAGRTRSASPSRSRCWNRGWNPAVRSLRPFALAPARTGQSQPTSQQNDRQDLRAMLLGDEGLEPRCGQAKARRVAPVRTAPRVSSDPGPQPSRPRISELNRAAGRRHSRVLRGRSLTSAAIRAMSSAVWTPSSVPLGK